MTYRMLILLLVASAINAQVPTIQVNNLGSVTGSNSIRSKNVAIYHAIPYARPPIGPLRWQPPVPMGKFGDIDGTTFGNRCMEPDKSPDGTKISEDCLFLNVNSPIDTTTTSKLPVMLWIHGGSCKFLINS